MNLGEARALLFKFISGGTCPTDARVQPAIDQAQRELFPLKPFVGTIARYAVLTEEAAGKLFFTIPDDLESVSRVTKYNGLGLSATLLGALICKDVGALVGQTGSYIKVSVEPADRRRLYVPPGTEAVDVAGKLVFVPAEADDDDLMIDDLIALQLMLQSIWRRQNDRLDLAGPLRDQAIARLSQVSDQLVEDARRLSYQATASTWEYGSVGYVRAKLATDLKHGIHYDDAVVFELLNKATDLLIGWKNFFVREKRLGVKDDMPMEEYVFLQSDDELLPVQDYPTIKLAALSILAQSDPQGIQLSQGLEKAARDSLEELLRTDLAERRFTRYEAEYQKFADYPDTLGYFRTRLALDLPGGLLLSDAELVRAINQAEEWAMVQGKWKGTIQNFKIPVPADGVIKLPRIVEAVLQASLSGLPAPVWGQDYDYHNNGPGYQSGHGSTRGNRLIDRGVIAGHRHYYVRDHCAPECGHFRVKLRYVRKVEDDERMAVTNYPAVRKAVESFLNPDPNAGISLREEAKQILSSELFEHQGGNRQSLQVQNVGSFGSIPHIN